MTAKLTVQEAQEWLRLDEIWQKDLPYLNITGQMGRYKELSHRAAMSGMSISDIKNAASAHAHD